MIFCNFSAYIQAYPGGIRCKDPCRIPRLSIIGNLYLNAPGANAGMNLNGSVLLLSADNRFLRVNQQ